MSKWSKNKAGEQVGLSYWGEKWPASCTLEIEIRILVDESRLISTLNWHDILKILIFYILSSDLTIL